MKTIKRSKDFILCQIKYLRRSINEYRQLSINYPEHKKIHDSIIKQELEKIKTWKEELN